MSKKVIILGSGPGGYSAALFGAQSGLEITLIEREQVGGVCLNRGCIPTKTLLFCSKLVQQLKKASGLGIKIGVPEIELPVMVERKNKLVDRLRRSVEFLLKKRGVNLVRGDGKVLSPTEVEVNGTVYSGDNLILAAGTSQLKLWQGERVITSDEALDAQELPQTLLVVGGGAVGIELATFFAQLGVKVTLMEMLPRILPPADPEVSETLAKELQKKGITVKTNTAVKTIEGKTVETQDGSRQEFDLILSAVGRKMNTENLGLEAVGLSLVKGQIAVNQYMETSVPGVFAVGDIIQGSPLLAHAAYHHGREAVSRIMGVKEDLKAEIPWCIFSSPQVAWVGKRPDELENPLVAKVPIQVLGIAQALEETAGFIKVVADRKTREIVGVHIIGESAAELIHVGAVAIKQRTEIAEMASMIFAHPTFSEMYGEAALLLEGKPFHMML